MSCCAFEGEEEEEGQRPDPTRVRGCTDIFWLCLFIAFWCLMILIAAFALVYGNPMRLISGYDSFGNTCGMRNEKFGKMDLSGQDSTEKPYLFFLDTRDVKHSLKICVKKCPDRTINSVADVCKFYKETGSQLCHLSSDVFECNDQSKNKTGYCPRLPVYQSVPILNRCIPKALKNATATLISNIYDVLNSWDTIEQILGDLYKTWRYILGLSFLAFCTNFLNHRLFLIIVDLTVETDENYIMNRQMIRMYPYVFPIFISGSWYRVVALLIFSGPPYDSFLSLFLIAIFHMLASIVTWIVMALVSVACVGGTGLLWWTYIGIKRTLDATDSSQLLEESVRNEKAFLTFAIIATFITVILLFLLCVIRNRISIMASLFKESAKCLAELPGLFLQPLLTFTALIGFFVFWIIVILCLATANYPGTKSVQMLNVFGNVQLLGPTDQSNGFVEAKRLDSPIKSSKTFTFVEFVDSTWVKYMWWVYIIGLIWISEFITSCQDMVIAGAVAHWYFRGKNASPSPVCSAMGNLVSYHLGSVACGSFLITIFKLPRLILTYLHQKFEGTKETSSCAQCGLKCCICCFFCLEKFIRYINHNAYTVIAIEGTPFCNAARIAFTTLVSNAMQIAIINGVGDFVLFLGKCFVMAATGSIGLLFMRQDPRLHFYAAPIFVTCVFSFIIAHCVISLYETVIDTLFLCVCEDKNLNGENGKWRQSPLALFDGNPDPDGQQAHELAPMNE